MSSPIFNVSNLDGSNGFRLDGEPDSYSGFQVGSPGDVNGDGFGDVTVRAVDAEGLGVSYVVFGQAAGFSASKDLSSLDGHDGFRVHGMTTYDSSGIVIDNGGDINGDGIEDMIVSESAITSTYEKVDHAYVVFGETAGFDRDIDLTSLDGEVGFVMQGASGSSDKIEPAGDINGDGFADVIASSVTIDSNGQYSGSSTVLFGRASGFDPVVELTNLDGQNGFLFRATAGGQSAYAVHAAGDVNGDGLADVIVGDPQADPHGDGSGSTYVVFGRTSGFDAVMDLSGLDGHTGFRLDGEEEQDFSSGIKSVGDINGDGFDDVIINAPGANKAPNNYYNSTLGARYIVFGKASGFDAHMDLSSLDGKNGFRLNGPEHMRGISSAGDINGDGSEDILISSSVFARYSSYDTGYVVFGKASGFDAAMDIGDLDGGNGFRMTLGGLYTSTSFSHAGDVNGDGFDDLIVGVQNGSYSGVSYLVLGRASGFPAMLSDSDDSVGVRLEQEQAGQLLGASVSDAGDVNGDGFDDVIVGAPGAGPNGENTDSSYVIFGRSNFQSDQTIRGTTGDDNLTGTTGEDRFEAGDGNDSMTGLGGADTFLAGNGDDVLKVADMDFQLADGGSGQDTLELTGNGFDLNLADFSDRIDQIETIDLTGNGDNTLTFSLADFLGVADSPNTLTDSLTVKGNAGDRIQVLDGNWTDGGADQNYRIFMHSGVTLRVDRSIDIDIVAGQGMFDLDTLDGDNGFLLDSTFIPASGATVGYSVSSAGDINGDGFDDVIVGSAHTYIDHRDSVSYFVVLGKASGFDAQMDLSKLDGSNGFRLDQAVGSGGLVSNAGDVNGDGFDDVIIGASYYNSNSQSKSGSSYVVLGKASGFDAQMDLSKLDGSNGFRLVNAAYASLGMPVSSAGDINGDGFDDVILGSPYEAFSSSSSYVLFGRASGFDAQMDLSKLDGSNGFRLVDAAYAGTGYSVSGAGDVNGDGLDDLIVGAPFTDPNGDESGSGYVVFGKASGFDASMNLSSLNGNNGFRLDGVAQEDFSGVSVSGAGDVNGDGFDDVIVSATGADPNDDNSGSSYVVFGRASGFAAQMDLSSLDGSNGFRLDGAVRGDGSGISVSGAGDVNGDGYDDVIIGAPVSGPYFRSGSSYVVFGKASGFDAILNLDVLDGNNGFRLDGKSELDSLGQSVSGAGDVNGDGFDDLLVGAPGANPNGTSYIIFGSADLVKGNGGSELPEIKGTDGDDTLKGSTEAEHLIAGDGNDNLLGRGGADVFDAGVGNDAIRIGDLTFASVDGGDGNDALHLAGADLNLDLTTLGDHINGVETICLYGRGDNTLTLNADSLLNLSDSTNTLKVHGNSGDHISLQDDGWVDGSSHGFYHTYTHDEAVLLVGANVTVEFV